VREVFPKMTPTAELGAKLQRVVAWLDERRADAVLVHHPSNIAWLACGGDVGRADAATAFVLTRERCALLLPAEDTDRVRQEETRGLAIEIVPLSLPGAAALVDRARDLAPATARWCADTTGFDFPGEPSFAALRSSLLPTECDRLRKLGSDAALAVEEVAAECYSGILERDAAGRLAAECHRRQITPVRILAGADERFEKYPRPLPKGAVAEKVLLLSLLGMRGGLHVTLSRTICLARPATAVLDRYEALMRGAARLRAAARAGTTLGAAVTKAALEELPAAHALGGVLGYAAYEAQAHPQSTWMLAAGQAIGWNLVIPGARCEDTTLLGGVGAEFLTMSENWPRRTVIIDRVPYDVPDLLLLL
jgi:antitoxin VapB